MKLYRNTTSYTARRRSHRGFALVELVTVLTILYAKWEEST
ncbi:MAG: prepilin-type N-terminal cleavage/methylation domain-containing protein [Saccharofermentans sp.]|nr:prepilin-type N-terminal cleavage/methylation domain-containing protein [Saccharofermentans sp.]